MGERVTLRLTCRWYNLGLVKEIEKPAKQE